jgi:16S rRNA (cytidine1402-2'-O)-methyltransferase
MKKKRNMASNSCGDDSKLGGLYIVATPIGNLGDITLRALETLKSADTIACEDTRKTKVLLEHYNINTPLTVYNDHSGSKERERLLEMITAGKSVALVSDAGTPLIADPGYKLVREARARNLKVISLPGASSLLTALTLSGLPSDHITFIGFLPQGKGKKENTLKRYKGVKTTLVCFESPRRLLETLDVIVDVYPDAEVTVARELTKMHEEVVTDSAQAVKSHFQARDIIKGEIVLLIHVPAGAVLALDSSEIREEIQDLMTAGCKTKAIADELSKKYTLSKKDVYNLALSLLKK